MSVLMFCNNTDAPEGGAPPPSERRYNAIKSSGGTCCRLICALKPETERIELCESITELHKRFHQPQPAPSVIVLAIGTQQTLNGLLSIKELFDGIPVIVVLVGRDAGVERQTYLLGPRYVGHANGNFEDVITVLVNLISR